jgi:N-acetyl sugar amidotransferase
MQVCTRCLYHSSHPLHLTFDNQGLCSGCLVHEEKDQLDWSERAKRLGSIFESYRNTSGYNYDCIVPVSGARDSYFTVHVVKNVYGMNPLLVTYNKQYNTAVGIRNLANLRIRFNCDIMTLTVNPDTVKKITRSTIRRFGSLYWHCLAGQTVYPVQMAVKLKIPLIVWGVHQGIDQVGMFSHFDEVEMTRKYRKEHDLMGFEAEDLIDDLDNISEPDIHPYCYPDNRELEQVGVRGIYLNNYIRWDSRTQHEEMIRTFGYETSRQTRTFDTYNDVDCWNYSDLHDYVKWLKHGYGKVVDHASRDIRLGHMSRADGARLILRYITRKPKNLSLFLDWLGVTDNALCYIIDQHRNSLFWSRNDNWQWDHSLDYLAALETIAEASQASSFVLKSLPFKETGPGRSLDPPDQYILIGKGAT